MDEKNTIFVTTSPVACDGSSKSHAEGHPVIYLELHSQKRTLCPYCGARYMLSQKESER